MSIDRRIGLDTAITHGSGLAQSDAQTSGRQASDADRRAFERAMAQGGDESSPAPSAAPTPFSLFGAAGAQAVVPADAPSGALAEALLGGAEQLLVADGSQGRRQVRVELKDEVLPGVSVSVYEAEGRVVADFVCANETSRERLATLARPLAEQLAENLGRPTRVRVGTDDPEDPCLTETDADAPLR
ncbi:hypothetical protein [Achromobacter xylosoxidans]|uniref:hypothetical protein n=1 Tax=Alcaligenes xylosoxydans xylosoxydans TaxID=85698 RepID=UPI001EEC4B4C|nr:hypothetical protein [Achromobacter xylosoxidans]